MVLGVIGEEVVVLRRSWKQEEKGKQKKREGNRKGRDRLIVAGRSVMVLASCGGGAGGGVGQCLERWRERREILQK
jgi:hypothetical protein